MPTADPWSLTPLEIASGFPIGPTTRPSRRPPVPGGATSPLAALERAVRSGLARPPCLVSFSGGRDSSAVLAVATAVARREGLPLPVPVTLRFPESAEADEAAWQTRVVGHLGLPDWVRLDLHDELDLVGPVATALLRRHGLIWPPNSHFHAPVLERAAGGSVLTGIDGDGLFGCWRWERAAAVLDRRVRPTPRDLLRVGLALSPPLLRRLHDRRGSPPALPWLTPEARHSLFGAWAEAGATEPLLWARRVRWWAGQRSVRMVLRSFELMAGDAGVQAVHPLADPDFLAALARAGGRFGPGDRTAVMRWLFGSLLPDDVLARPTKAILNHPFWNRHSRAFVATWTGEGVDTSLVDRDALRRHWSSQAPHACSSTLLQSAWLSRFAPPTAASVGDEVEEPFHDEG